MRKTYGIDNTLYKQLQADLRKNKGKKREYIPIAIFHEESMITIRSSQKTSIKNKFIVAINSLLK